MIQRKVLIVFGTRPEAIKMVPVIKELEKTASLMPIVCVTGQHREMLDQVLHIFKIKPDYDLEIMKSGQDLFDITSRIILGMRDILRKVKPDMVLVHGDTTTSMAAALSAFYERIPVGHVEAGLRTYNVFSPWPEEMNRQLTGRLATLHFAPTEKSRENLLAEGINNNHIIVTGNTVIDTLYSVSTKLVSGYDFYENAKKELTNAGYDLDRIGNGRKIVLITGHRRENFGEGFISICRAIDTLAAKFPNVDFVYPMHLNPNVRNSINTVFSGRNTKPDNLFLIEPLQYLSFVLMMKEANIVLTDSGGIQEEAPGLGKPVLVMRDTTERPEAVVAGTVKLVGTDKDAIVSAVSELLTDQATYLKMSNAVNPYGDGLAASRIKDTLVAYFQ